MIRRKDIQEWCRDHNMPYTKSFGDEIIKDTGGFEEDLQCLIIDYFKERGEWDLVDSLTNKEGGYYFR